MTIEEDIAFWERAATTAERRGSALVYAGIAAGLKMARNDYLPREPTGTAAAASGGSLE